MIKQIFNRLPRNKASLEGNEGPVGLDIDSGSNSSTNQLMAASGMHAPNGTIKILPAPTSNSSIEPLPLFRDVPISERPNLFLGKLTLCSNIFDFRDPTKNLKEKDIKKQTLLELVDFISAGTMKITEQVIEVVTKMVATNLFRALPPSMHENAHLEGFDMEDEEPTLELAWPHLQVVYEFFLRFITLADVEAKTAKQYINQSFVLKLMDLFDSEDSRERDYLKMVLHRIYGKFMVHRPFIRKAVNNIFYHFVFETERHNGIAELLEILGSIINGFAIPLKEEHKIFLVRALMPLHKAKCVSMYHRALCYCMTQFIEKDSKLADTVIRGLLKYWPLTNSHKEVLFLGELEEVLEATQPEVFQQCMVPLFRQVGRCLNSAHFQVAERALFMWNNDHIVNLVTPNRAVILPIILPALESNSSSHWNQSIHDMTMNARKLFTEMDRELFQDCNRRYREEQTKAAVLREKQNYMWQRLEVMASTKGIVK